MAREAIEAKKEAKEKEAELAARARRSWSACASRRSKPAWQRRRCVSFHQPTLSERTNHRAFQGCQGCWQLAIVRQILYPPLLLYTLTCSM